MNKTRSVIVWSAMFLGSCGCNNNQEKLAIDYKNLFEQKIDAGTDLLSIFPRTVDEISSRAAQAKAYAQKGMNAIFAIKPEERTFQNTILEFDIIQDRYESTHNALFTLVSMSPDAAIRDVAQKEMVQLRTFGIDVFSDKKIANAFREYRDNQGKKDSLTDEQQYHMQKQFADFKRSGFDLSDEQFTHVKDIQKQLSDLTSQFEVNVDTDNRTITVAPELAAGIDASMLASFEKNEKGHYVIPCKSPSSGEVLQECHSSEIRKLMAQECGNRGYPKNMAVLDKIIALRDDLAKTIGFASYAALDIEPSMAQTTERVTNFVADLAKKTRKKWLNELQEYASVLPKGVVRDAQGRLNSWDLNYVLTQQKKKTLAIDNREVAQYFEVQKTLKGIFDIYATALGLRFEMKKPSWSWHDDVDMLEVHDEKSNELLGIILLDLYPRKNKNGHAFHEGIITTYYMNKPDGSEYRKVDMAVVLANFPRAMGDLPALFKHDDVVTFFHEFGHAMHSVLGTAHLPYRSGTRVARDFVEVPSQAFELWMFDKETLKKLSCHYQTGKPLPDSLIENISKQIQFDSGSFVLRQCILSMISLRYFLDGAKKDTDAIWNEIYTTFMPELVLNPDSHPQVSFGHLVGYDAKYYSYMWSKVMSLDVFAMLKKEGLSRTAGKRFADCVLCKGGSDDPNVLIKDYLGREPNMDAFLQILGMK